MEAGVRPKRTTMKGSRELRNKSFHYLLEAGRLLFGSGFDLCHPSGPHIFFIHESVAQHSDKQRTVALTTCSQHGVIGWVWRMQ